MLALKPRTDIITRCLRSNEDWAAIGGILEACRVADGHDTVRTADQFSAALATLPGFDPAEGVRLALDDGRVVGYAFGVCDGDNPGIGRILYHGGGVLPGWRGRGIGRRLLAEAQAATRRHAARRPGLAPMTAVYRSLAGEDDHDTRRLLEADGHEIARYGYSMLRPTLADPPSPDLPPGIEARPGSRDRAHRPQPAPAR